MKWNNTYLPIHRYRYIKYLLNISISIIYILKKKTNKQDLKQQLMAPWDSRCEEYIMCILYHICTYLVGTQYLLHSKDKNHKLYVFCFDVRMLYDYEYMEYGCTHSNAKLARLNSVFVQIYVYRQIHTCMRTIVCIYYVPTATHTSKYYHVDPLTHR